MINKEMNMIIKIMGLVGVIFCLIALLTPWGSPPGGSFFTFGFFSDLSSSAFYIDYFNSGIGEVIFFAVVLIIIFIITLVALLLGVFAINRIGYKTNKFLTLGILMIVNVILYGIAMSTLAGNIGSEGYYSIGFIMAIIAAIMYFIVYSLQRTFMPAPAPRMYQQPIYQQPTYQQPAYQQQPMYSHPQQPPMQQTGPQPQPQTSPVQTSPQEKETPSKTKTIPKFCPQCGAQLIPNAKFCSSCGNKL